MQLAKFFLMFGLILTNACSSDASDSDDGSCTPDDADGLVGGNNAFTLTVSDTAFAVGGVNSGSMQRNITVQNSSTVMLTVTNVGKKPHSLQIGCIPTGLPSGCPQTSCFPDAANIPPIVPGDSVSVTFSTPAVEGSYQFTSTEPGDTTTAADGTVSGLVGQFVLN